jgi:Leucine-rich repeat (LRR) protein
LFEICKTIFWYLVWGILRRSAVDGVFLGSYLYPLSLSTVMSAKIWMATVGLVVLGLQPGAGASEAAPETFYEWCMSPGKSSEVRATIEALFWVAGTKRCVPAAQRLAGREELDLTGLSVRDLGPIAGLPKLRKLVLDRNPVRDLTPLGKLAQLQVLSVNQSSLKRLDGVETIGSLQALSIDRTLVRDLGPIAGLVGLKELSARGDRLESIAPLAGLKSLRYLALENNRIEELTPLTFLGGLEELRLANNRIRDIQPLAGLTVLQTLTLSSNRIADFRSLQSLPRLKRVELLGMLLRSNPCPASLNGGSCVYQQALEPEDAGKPLPLQDSSSSVVSEDFGAINGAENQSNSSPEPKVVQDSKLKSTAK